MLEIAAPHHMVFGHLLQRVLAEAVEPAVADMDAMAGAAGQDQSGESGRHVGEFGIDAALRDDPGIDGVERPRRRLPNAERAGQGEEAVEKTAHGEFGRLAPALVPADAVRHRGDGGGAASIRAPPDPRRGVILVVGPPPPFGGEADLVAQVVVEAVEAGHDAGRLAGRARRTRRPLAPVRSARRRPRPRWCASGS